MNKEVKIDEKVIDAVTDIGHCVKHIRMFRKVRDHLLAVRQREREYSQERYYKKVKKKF